MKKRQAGNAEYLQGNNEEVLAGIKGKKILVTGGGGSIRSEICRQIAQGGFVTVTDKNVIRYFMTIPEAVSLVLQASYYAEEGRQSTKNKLIHIGKPIEMNDDWFKQKLIQLDEASYRETDEIKEMVAEIVPTYHYEKVCHQKEKSSFTVRSVSA